VYENLLSNGFGSDISAFFYEPEIIPPFTIKPPKKFKWRSVLPLVSFPTIDLSNENKIKGLLSLMNF
jgi:hypothetical protein